MDLGLDEATHILLNVLREPPGGAHASDRYMLSFTRSCFWKWENLTSTKCSGDSTGATASGDTTQMSEDVTFLGSD
ncbi:hypothetical protein ILYODFUR_001189 [Ilyodon furcidens]|uniref:Uncharacterized protein n=1 Tax=Ilyodon furcidens TaxID=33524 RepID=A0ABV0V2X5_9TELE